MNESKKISLLNLLLFLSSFICCAGDQLTIKKQDKLIDLLYQKKDSLNSLDLDSETIISYIQILKERKAVLHYTLAHQVGFSKNYEMFKGLVSMPYGVSGFVTSLLAPFCADHIIQETSAEGIVTERVEFRNISWHIALPMRMILMAVSLWILKNSCENLYIGWTRKKQALEKIAKIDEILALLENR